MTTVDVAPGVLLGGDMPVSNEADGVGGEIVAVEDPHVGEGGQSASDGVEVTSDEPELDLLESLFAAPDVELNDVAVASPGLREMKALPETVHGPDDRVKIANTAVYPWRVHASLLITARDGSQYVGTAWFIGPRTLVTAGHCVFIQAPGQPEHGWVRSIRVMPGRNGAFLPYGAVLATSFRSVQGWTVNGDENYDYGAIILPTPLGEKTGWLGFANYDDATLRSMRVNISGYPADKPAGTQWFAANRIASVNSRKVFYDIDTFGGQSGSAVYRLVDGKRIAVGVHAYGGPVTNSGTRINAAVYANMLSWKQNP